jgi:hypothetical protein
MCENMIEEMAKRLRTLEKLPRPTKYDLSMITNYRKLIGKRSKEMEKYRQALHKEELSY